MQNLSKNEVVAEFRSPEISQRDINALLWAAFPAASEHAVSQRAGLLLDKDPRTIRSWMSGRTQPSWTEVRVISVYAGVEKAMQIMFGRRR